MFQINQFYQNNFYWPNAEKINETELKKEREKRFRNFHKMTMSMNNLRNPDDDVMALQASNRLFHNKEVYWMWTYLRFANRNICNSTDPKQSDFISGSEKKSVFYCSL